MALWDHELDARGLRCPLPILKTRFAIEKLRPGEVLKVISTDAGSRRDMEAFSRQTGNDLISTTVEGDEFIFLLRRG